MVLHLNKLGSQGRRKIIVFYRLCTIWTHLFFLALRRFLLSMAEICLVLLEKENSKCFAITSPRKRSAPSFENTWILFTQRWSSSSVLEIGPVVLDTKVFKVIYEFSWLFPLDHIKAWSFIWKKTDSLYARMFFAKFSWKWPSGSSEEDEYQYVKKLWLLWKIGKTAIWQVTSDTFWSERLIWAFSSGELK